METASKVSGASREGSCVRPMRARFSRFDLMVIYTPVLRLPVDFSVPRVFCAAPPQSLEINSRCVKVNSLQTAKRVSGRSASQISNGCSLAVAGVHLHPRGPGRSADRQRLLGAVLPGARHPAGWKDARRYTHRQGGRLLQHLLQRDRGWEACPPGCVCRPGTHSRRYVKMMSKVTAKQQFNGSSATVYLRGLDFD